MPHRAIPSRRLLRLTRSRSGYVPEHNHLRSIIGSMSHDDHHPNIHTANPQFKLRTWISEGVAHGDSEGVEFLANSRFIGNLPES